VDWGSRDDHWRSDCRCWHLRLEQWYVREARREGRGDGRVVLDFDKRILHTHTHTHTHTIDTGKFPLFTDPSPGYHGLKFWEMFGGEKVRVCVRACLCESAVMIDATRASKYTYYLSSPNLIKPHHKLTTERPRLQRRVRHPCSRRGSSGLWCVPESVRLLFTLAGKLVWMCRVSTRARVLFSNILSAIKGRD